MRQLIHSLLGLSALLLSACHPSVAQAPPPPRTSTNLFLASHDAPIVVQGGSLWVWSSIGFSGTSNTQQLQVVVSNTTTVTPLTALWVSYDAAFSDLTDLSQAIALAPPATSGPSWIVCSAPKHFAQIAPDLTGATVTITSWDPYAGNSPQSGVSLPVFSPTLYGDNTVGNPFGFGRLHRHPDELKVLYYAPGGTSCPAVFSKDGPGPLPLCPTGIPGANGGTGTLGPPPSQPCRIRCPSDSQAHCFFVFSRK